MSIKYLNRYWTLQSPIWIFQNEARVPNMDFSKQGLSSKYRYLDAMVVSLVFNANNHCYKLYQNLNQYEIDLTQIFVLLKSKRKCEIKRSFNLGTMLNSFGFIHCRTSPYFGLLPPRPKYRLVLQCTYPIEFSIVPKHVNPLPHNPNFQRPWESKLWKHCRKMRKYWWQAFSPFPAMFSTLSMTNFAMLATF